jgi:hypothetical protein
VDKVLRSDRLGSVANSQNRMALACVLLATPQHVTRRNVRQGFTLPDIRCSELYETWTCTGSEAIPLATTAISQSPVGALDGTKKRAWTS